MSDPIGIDIDQLSDTGEEETVFRAKEVTAGPEFARIMALPRRLPPRFDGDPERQFADWLTDRLAKTAEPYPGRLRPLQAACLSEAYQARGLAGFLRVGGGKAQPNSEPILLDKGWTPIGDVKQGDKVYGADGLLHTVVGVFPQGKRPVYELAFSDGSCVRSDIDHLWTFDVSTSSSPTGKRRETRTLRDWLPEKLKRKCGEHQASRVFLPMISPIQREEKHLPLDPYTLGVLLGDACMSGKSVNIASMDDEIILALDLPGNLVANKTASTSGGRASIYNLTSPNEGRGHRRQHAKRNPLVAILKHLGLQGHTAHTKFIPQNYKESSINQRLAILQGLFDTDGYAQRDAVDFCVASKTLRDDVAEVAESLGGTATKADKTLVYKGENKTYYRCLVKLPRHFVPFRLSRKAEANRKSRAQRPPFRALERVSYVGEQQCTCISVNSPDHLYVTKNHCLTHNTVLSHLLPVILKSVRWLLIAPASMKDDAKREFDKIACSWESSPNRFPFLSYEKLSNPSAGEDTDDAGNVSKLSLIEQFAPQLIVMDEAHKAGSGNIASKRIKAYLRKNPSTVVVVLTGTPFRTSIRDAAQLLEWALGDRSPLPRPSKGFKELQAWASYLDVSNAKRRAGVGCLLDLLTKQEMVEFARHPVNGQRRIVRRAVARRMYETLGVVSSQDGKLVDDSGREIGITVEPLYPAAEDPEINSALEKLLREKRLPDGTELVPDGQEAPESVFSLARHARTIAHGFTLAFDPPLPPEYRGAWNEWATWAKKLIARNNRGIDSPARAEDAVRRGLYKDGGRLEAWKAAQAAWREETGLREPASVPTWFSDETVETVRLWINQHQGAVWVHNIALGERLSEKLGIPYYRAQSCDADGRHISKHPGGPAILSVQSNGTGKNLQGLWSDNLWCCAPNEQSLGRTHRAGQQADTVRNYVYLPSAEWARAFERSRDMIAEFQEDMTLTPTKLQYADCSVPTEQELADERGGIRWGRSF